MKQVILIRTDLKLGKGKIAAQCSHASVEATMKSKKEIVQNWRRQGMKKVVLKVKDEEELLKFKKLAGQNKIINALITDAGYTQIPKGTKTCLAIGPDEETKIDKITKNLKML